MGNKKSRKNQSPSLLDSFGHWIIYIMVGVIPHIYYYTGYKTKPSELKYFPNEYYADLYMLAKSRAFLLLSVLLLCVFIYQVLSKRITFIKDKITIGAGIFAGVVILSSVMSEYQDMVYWGAKDRHEGMWVWLAYVTLFVIVRHYSDNESFIKNTFKVLLYSASLMGIFGLMQILGFDIYTEGPLKWLCFPNEIAANINQYMTTNTTSVLAVGALYNSNYFGVYMAISVLIGLWFYISNMTFSPVYLVLTLISYAAMIASKSEAALLAFAAGVFVLILQYGMKIFDNKKNISYLALSIIAVDRVTAAILKYGQSSNALYIYIIMIGAILLGILLTLVSEKKIAFKASVHKYKLILAGLIMLILVGGMNIGVQLVGDFGETTAIENIVKNDTELEITYFNGAQNFLLFENEQVSLLDGAKDVVSVINLDNSKVTVTLDEVNYDCEIRPSGSGYKFKINKPTSMNFYYDGQDVSYYSRTGNVVEIIEQDRIDYYYKNGSAFTNRGYIWSVTIPKAIEKLAFGYGLDTFIKVLPQDDFVGKTNFYSNGNELLIDKPHSTYLSILLTMGIGAFVIFVCLPFIMVRNLLGRFDVVSLSDVKGLLAVVSIVILTAGIFNDSAIPITLILSSFAGIELGQSEVE